MPTTNSNRQIKCSLTRWQKLVQYIHFLVYCFSKWWPVSLSGVQYVPWLNKYKVRKHCSKGLLSLSHHLIVYLVFRPPQPTVIAITCDPLSSFSNLGRNSYTVPQISLPSVDVGGCQRYINARRVCKLVSMVCRGEQVYFLKILGLNHLDRLW